MDRKDLLNSNGQLFKSQAKMIEKTCKKTTKILVVGNPCNTNALAILKSSSIKEENITALSRLDENRALAVIASELGIRSHWIKNVAIYGNHSKTMVVDVTKAFYVKDLDPIATFNDIKEGR
jgi:malate/lactate dehydrogenase